MRSEIVANLLLVVLGLVVLGSACTETAVQSPTVEDSGNSEPIATVEERLDSGVLKRLQDRQAWNQRVQSDATVAADRKAEALGEVAMLHHAYDLYPEAEEFYSQAIQRNGSDHRWFYLRGMARRRSNDTSGAIADFRSAVDLQPENVPSRVRLGEILRDQGEQDESLAILRSALEQDPICAAALFALGQDARSRNDLADAVRLFEQVLELQPDASAVRTPLGLSYRDLGREDDARTQLAEAGNVGVRLNDPLLQRIYELGEGWSDTMRQASESARHGDFEEAERQLKIAIGLDPLAPAPRVSLGRIFFNRGEAESAAQQLSLALFLSESAPQARRTLAQIAIANQDWRQAEVHLGSIGADEQTLADRATQARVLERLGRASQALDIYRDLRNEQPENSEVWVGEAAQLVTLERCPEATDLLSQGLAARPNDAVLGHALARLLATCTATRDSTRALQLARSLFNGFATPGHGEAVAMALASTGNTAEAVTWQRRAMELAGTSDPAYPWLTANYQRLASELPITTPWPQQGRSVLFQPPSSATSN